MDEKDRIFTLQFTEKELTAIYDIFDNLTSEGLNKWIALISEKGNCDGEECLRQWRETDMLDEIRRKAGVALGVEQVLTDDEIKKEL